MVCGFIPRSASARQPACFRVTAWRRQRLGAQGQTPLIDTRRAGPQWSRQGLLHLKSHLHHSVALTAWKPRASRAT